MWARFHSWGISRRMETGEVSTSGDGLSVMRNRRHLYNHAFRGLLLQRPCNMDRESPNSALSVVLPKTHFLNGCSRAGVQSQHLVPEKAAAPDCDGRVRASALIHGRWILPVWLTGIRRESGGTCGHPAQEQTGSCPCSVSVTPRDQIQRSLVLLRRRSPARVAPNPDAGRMSTPTALSRDAEDNR